MFWVFGRKRNRRGPDQLRKGFRWMARNLLRRLSVSLYVKSCWWLVKSCARNELLPFWFRCRGRFHPAASRLRRSQTESELMTSSSSKSRSSSSSGFYNWQQTIHHNIVCDRDDADQRIRGNCRVLTLPLSSEEQLMCCQVARFQHFQPGAKPLRLANSPDGQRRFQNGQQLFAADLAATQLPNALSCHRRRFLVALLLLLFSAICTLYK